MQQELARDRAQIADLRAAIAAAANDPPAAGMKLMMSAEDVAALMGDGRTADTVRDKHRLWTRKNGFPAPMPGMLPLVWSGPQILSWLRGPAETPAISHAAPAVSDLQRKYGSAR